MKRRRKPELYIPQAPARGDTIVTFSPTWWGYSVTLAPTESCSGLIAEMNHVLRCEIARMTR